MGGWRGSEYTAAPRVCIEAEATGRMRGWGGVDGGAVSIYLESVSRLRRLALVDRVVGMGGWGGWRGSEYTAAPRVCIEAEATGRMRGWGGVDGGAVSIYPESVLRLRRLADRVVGVDGGAVSIYLESVSRLRRLSLVERVVGMGWMDGWMEGR